MFATCSICGKPTKVFINTALPVRHADCHAKWLGELLFGPGRPVNELARQLIDAREQQGAS